MSIFFMLEGLLVIFSALNGPQNSPFFEKFNQPFCGISNFE
jgi:hypothetical protein